MLKWDYQYSNDHWVVQVICVKLHKFCKNSWYTVKRGFNQWGSYCQRMRNNCGKLLRGEKFEGNHM